MNEEVPVLKTFAVMSVLFGFWLSCLAGIPIAIGFAAGGLNLLFGTF